MVESDDPSEESAGDTLSWPFWLVAPEMRRHSLYKDDLSSVLLQYLVCEEQ